jgi:hypothetical protein
LKFLPPMTVWRFNFKLQLLMVMRHLECAHAMNCSHATRDGYE